MWKLKSYTSQGGKKLVREWYDEQDESVQIAFEIALKFLSQQPPEWWDRPRIGKLRKECKGLIEIIFEVGNVQHRPIGYYSGKLEFTIVAFATERGGKFDPVNVCETAKKRIAIIEADKERAREFRLP
jgi:hypothetical protein